MTDTINTPEFRVSFPHVFETQKNDLGDKVKWEYSVQALFPLGADLSSLKQLCRDACKKKWGSDPSNWPDDLKLPFRDQSEKPMKNKDTGKIIKDEQGNPVLMPGHVAGAPFITLKTTQKPRVVDPSVQDIIDPSEFYGGCYAIASVNAFAWGPNKGGFGVSLGLNNIQKTREGESLGATRTKPEDDFKPVEGAGDDEGEGQPAAAGAASLFDLGG